MTSWDELNFSETDSERDQSLRHLLLWWEGMLYILSAGVSAPSDLVINALLAAPCAYWRDRGPVVTIYTWVPVIFEIQNTLAVLDWT